MTPYHPDDRYNRLERAAVLALTGHLRDGFNPDDFSLDAYGTDAYDPDGLRPDRGLSGDGRGFGLSFADPGENIVAAFGDRNTPHITTIHAKINRDGEGEPEYYEHECPAIGISATGQPGEDRETLRRSLIRINAVIDMVVYGADMGRVDEEIELIASAVQAFIAREMRVTTPMDGYFLRGECRRVCRV